MWTRINPCAIWATSRKLIFHFLIASATQLGGRKMTGNRIQFSRSLFLKFPDDTHSPCFCSALCRAETWRTDRWIRCRPSAADRFLRRARSSARCSTVAFWSCCCWSSSSSTRSTDWPRLRCLSTPLTATWVAENTVNTVDRYDTLQIYTHIYARCRKYFHARYRLLWPIAIRT